LNSLSWIYSFNRLPYKT